VAWPARYHEGELSAIQHAINLKLRNEAAFWSEYQNEPLPDPVFAAELTADQVAARVTGRPRGVAPLETMLVTGFVDVQAAALYWVLVAWAADFTGSVIDYGTYPDQGRHYFTLRDVRRTLARVAPGTGLEGAIHAGLETLIAQLATRPIARDDGAELRIDRLLVDANWSVSTEIVYSVCRASPHAAVVMPSHGRYVGASSRPMSEWHRKPGDRRGLNWTVPAVEKRAIRHLVFDTNYWKSFVHARLATAPGDRGALRLFGDRSEVHRMFAEHLTAEYRVATTGRGRTVEEWKARPDGGDNHWLDGLVGAAVAASLQGAALAGQAAPRPARRRYTGADANKAAAASAPRR
jgi:hypothetical protein